MSSPGARATDPYTSHLAAAHHASTGAKAAQQAQTVAAVKAHPGSTSAELAMRSNLDRHAVARRLPECEEDGTVRRADAKRCLVTGRLSLTWFPVEP